MWKGCIFQFFGLHLDLVFTFEKLFGLWFDLDWVLKNQFWIAKYDSPLISGRHCRVRTEVPWLWLISNSSRVARLAILEPKTRNLSLLWSTSLQNFHLANWIVLGFFATFSFHKFFLEKRCDFRVARVACPRHHEKTICRPPHSCAMHWWANADPDQAFGGAVK